VPSTHIFEARALKLPAWWASLGMPSGTFSGHFGGAGLGLLVAFAPRARSHDDVLGRGQGRCGRRPRCGRWFLLRARPRRRCR
jgi:hypothetical protein